MIQDVQKLMLARFSALYGAPAAPNPQAVIDEYTHALKGFTLEALQHGADKVIAENTFRAWPTVGECVKACRDYRAPRSFGNAPLHPSDDAVILPPGDHVRTAEEREAHIARTMEMIAELKATAQANVTGERGKKLAPDRNFFAARGWGTGKTLASVKRNPE
jgi:hypothetical protein